MSPSPHSDAPAALEQLLADVQAQPWAHDFFALLRRIDALRPDAPRTGEALRPRQEALRLAQPPEMDFAPAPLAHMARRSDGVPRLAVRFFGLLGPQGPMPLHFTEYVRERSHQHGDHAPAHFLDLFHHRMLALFYRAWAQAQPVVQHDRPGADRYRVWLGAAAGLPAPAALPAPALAYQAGLLAERSRHAEGLVKVLGEYFDVPVDVTPHAGHWLPLPAEDRSRLGFARNRGEATRLPAAQLGVSATAGSRVWDRQFRFKLRLGPLPLARHDGFLPGGTAWRPLLEWMRLLAGAELSWELELDLVEAQRPAPRLGARRHGLAGARLGVACWLTGRGGTPQRPLRPLRIRPNTCFLQRQPRPEV